MQKILQKL